QLELDLELSIPKLEHYETLQELSAQYYLLFEQITSRLIEKRSSKQEELIRRIKTIVEQRFADPNLSLNAIADELSMSTYHISRVYRQHNPSTIVDTINHVRMSHAKQLLIQGDASVADIAVQTGYTSSSYFHRMFKKLY